MGCARGMSEDIFDEGTYDLRRTLGFDFQPVKTNVTYEARHGVARRDAADRFSEEYALNHPTDFQISSLTHGTRLSGCHAVRAAFRPVMGSRAGNPKAGGEALRRAILAVRIHPGRVAMLGGMMRSNRLRLQGSTILVSAVAIGLLAGCAGRSTFTPSPTNLGSADTLARLRLGPDVSPPPNCKGQKTTKVYAEVAKEVLKRGGGSLCVPAFKYWGGALQYPQQYGSYTYDVKLISSTTAYKGSLLPPAGSKTPLFYLQIGFNSFPGFYPALPKGAPLVSSHFKPGKSYTIELFEYFYNLGWSAEGSCYQVAKKSANGGSLAGAGTVFEKLTFLEHNGALEIFEGALVSTRCKAT